MTCLSKLMTVFRNIQAALVARRARLVRLAGSLSPADRAALGTWLATRAGLAALTWPAAFISAGSARSPRGWLTLWQRWDALTFVDIAQHGYFAPGERAASTRVAFFPGLPIVIAAVHLVVRQWTVTGLAVSFIAGAVAIVALSRIAERYYLPGAGRNAVLFLVVSPAAVFLAAGYSESLFLALAVTSWLAAMRGRWTLAVLLAGLASVVRVNGLFLCAAIGIEILRRADGQRIRSFVGFIGALVPLACFEIYLRLSTGSWLAWQHAEEIGWQRRFTYPVETFIAAWRAGFGHEFTARLAFVFQLEIVAVAMGVAATVALLCYRRWAEATYVGLTVAALATSTWYESVPRALLLLWPVWCGLAALAVRRRWVGQLYLALSIPVSVSISLLFMSGSWAGLRPADPPCQDGPGRDGGRTEQTGQIAVEG